MSLYEDRKSAAAEAKQIARHHISTWLPFATKALAGNARSCMTLRKPHKIRIPPPHVISNS